MAANYVELLVRARDTATPEMDDLKARLAELGQKVATARAEVDDEAAAAKLDKMQAALLRLGKTTANPKISMEGALRAEAQIHAVEASLDDLKRKEDEADIEGFGSKIEALFSGGGGGGGGLSSMPGLSFLENPEALLAVVPAIAAAVTEAGALVTAFAAAGLGVGSLAALAYPAFKEISGAIGDSKAQLAKLPAPVREVVDAVKGLKGQFSAMAKQLQPDIFKIFNEGLKIASKLMPYLGKFAKAAAPAVERVMKALSKDISSAGFRDLMNMLLKMSPGVITAIGNGMLQLAGDVGKLMESFSKKDVLNAVHIAFDILGGAIKAVGFIIKSSMSWWDNVTRLIRDVKQGFDDASAAITKFLIWAGNLASEGASAVSKFASAVASHVSAVITWFKSLPGKITGALGNLGSLLLAGGRDVIDGLLHGIQDAASAVWSFIRAIPGKIRDMLSGAGTWLLQIGRDIIDGLIHGIEDAAGGLLSTVKNLAGDVTGAFKDVLGIFSPSKVFYQHGQDIVAGLVQGINASAGQATNAMRKLGLSGLPGTAGGGYAMAAYGAASGSASAPLRLEYAGGSGTQLEQALWEFMRQKIRVTGGGNVQAAMGYGGRGM